MKSSLSEDEYDSLASFRYAMRKFLRFSRDFLSAQAELTPEQYEALLAIKTCSTKSGLTVGELGERLQVKQHTAVSLVDKLVARQLATRTTGNVDRRHVHLKLTRKGTTLLGVLASAHRYELRHQSAEMIDALTRLRGKS